VTAYIVAAFLALVAVVAYFRRRELAQAQAAVLGGTILPGCVFVEILALLAMALAIAYFGFSDS
jgi:hypothetical protein